MVANSDGGEPVRGGFPNRLRERLDMLNRAEIKSPRALLVSKTRDRGMCADRPLHNRCCLGQDWNCQPPNSICSCDQHCRQMGDCCPDYNDTCGSFTEKESTCTQTGTARANGDPHYHSFDMKMVHFQGKCSYVLAQNCQPGLEDFKIVAKNENRYGNMEMSWTKNIFIKYGQVKIEINKDRVLKLNNVRFYPPHTLPDGTVVDKSGNYVSITTYFGIQIFYDGDGNAEIKASCDWHGKLCGLLGNFNGNPKDDMMGRDDELYDEKTAEAFGESWRHWDNSPGCELTPSTVLPKSEKWSLWIMDLKNRPDFDGSAPACTDQQFDAAVRKCNIIQSERDKFATCHAKVNPSTFFENCVWDQCATNGDPSVFCDSVATFGRACADAERPINWRSKTLCPARCPTYSHYDFCGPMCVKTCKEPKRDETCGNDNGKCIEGCYCNKGYLWDGLKCVKKENCGCVYGDSSYSIQQTFYTKNCLEKCTCTGIDKSECVSSTCQDTKVCELNESKEYICKTSEIIGSSMHLGQKPKGSNRVNVTTTARVNMTTTARPSTTVKKTIPKTIERIQHNEAGKLFDEPDPINISPFVEFPDCLPTYKWKNGPVKPDWIPPNSCCGPHPYNDNVLSCCNNRDVYDEREEKCCRRHGTVVKFNEKCKPATKLNSNPKLINMISLNLR